MSTITIYIVDHTFIISTKRMARRKKKGVSAKKGENKENQPQESQHKASNRPAKLRIWSNQAMLQAMETVKSGYMGMNRAAIEHGVPRTTLKDRLSGRVIHGTNIGPKPYLTQEEEKQLVQFLVNWAMAKQGGKF